MKIKTMKLSISTVVEELPAASTIPPEKISITHGTQLMFPRIPMDRLQDTPTSVILNKKVLLNLTPTVISLKFPSIQDNSMDQKTLPNVSKVNSIMQN